jgi:hypothetical protein
MKIVLFSKEKQEYLSALHLKLAENYLVAYWDFFRQDVFVRLSEK